MANIVFKCGFSSKFNKDKVLLKLLSMSVYYRHRHYSLMRKKTDKIILKNGISEKFRKQLFFTCISPEYVFHESPKEFWKNNYFENMRASFFRRCQN